MPRKETQLLDGGHVQGGATGKAKRGAGNRGWTRKNVRAGFFFFLIEIRTLPKWSYKCCPGKFFLLEAKGRVMFHHHHLCNFTDGQNTAFKCSLLPQARPTCAHVVPWHRSRDQGHCRPLTEGPQGQRAAQLTAPSWTTSALFSSLTRAGSADRQEAVSHHWSVSGF